MTHPHRTTVALLLFLLVPAALLAVRPAGPETSVRVQQAGVAINPLVGVFDDGGFVVAWGTGAPKTVVHARIFDEAGDPASGEFRLSQPANQRLDDLKVTADGDFVAVWEQPRAGAPQETSVVARRFDRRGVAKSRAFVVHDPSPGAVYGARLAATADGGFAVAFTENVSVPNDVNFRRDTFVRFFNAASGAQGPALLVEMGSTQDDAYLLPGAMAAAADGTVVLISQCVCDEAEIRLHRIVPGVGVQSIDVVPGGDSPRQLSPSLAMAADGSFLVVWQTGSELPQDGLPSVIRARRFSASGQGLGAAFQVNRRGNHEGEPHAAALTDGEYAVIWNDGAGRDGGSYGVFSRGFAADGTTAGPDRQVNLTGAEGQFGTSLSATEDAVAVWLAPGPSFDVSDPAGAQVVARCLRPH